MADNSSPSRFGQTLTDLLDSVSCRRVNLEDTEDPVYRLRYEAYRREEFIPINSQKVSGDKYDNTPNAYCFGIYIDEQLVSSIRFHHATPECRHSPSRSIYPELIDPWLDEGKTILDPSRFTADHDASLAIPGLPFLTTRIIIMATDYFGVKYCMSTVRPEHGAFYRRVFHSKPMGDIRYYDGLNFPVQAYVADVPEVLPGIYARYPFYRSTPEERDLLFGEEGKYTLGRFVKATSREAQHQTGTPID